MNDHRRAIGRVLALVLFAAVAVVPLTASAQTEAQKREAKEHYEKATRLYEVEKYAEAIEAYQKVYLLVDDPNMLFNIAQAYRLWGKPDEAVRSYRNYLRRSPNAVNRADVEKKIADLERTIEERKRVPLTPTTPTPTTPAPEVVAPTPPAPATTTVPPPATTTTTTTVEPPPVTVTQPVEPGPDTNRGKRILAYSLLIGGGALLATAVAAGAVANQKAKEIEKASNDPNHPPFDPSIEKAGKNANSIAIITGLVGAAAAATGGILLMTSGSSSQRVSLFPVLGPQVAGGGARVTF